jgi:hypothetical protein
MPISVQPLVIDYSFVGAREQATDTVDLVALDAALGQIVGKLNEIIEAVNTIQRDDDHLHDGAVAFDMLNDDVIEFLSSEVKKVVAP